ncbi:DUF1778 domain-containing protein [Mesorhizobium sp. NZP2077]|uniref:type II toxin -antitoxin system TacA 1-like antitoxin n=1 Tax=Mesorhizobium sp. NZP2077 TaxID=2483404 RepID=UPI0015550D87|nr:DUF1778 domain-containing protein [Mesorhizobium sp. NZP2077]QKC84929.1 DUF1778 domain-containing protein [Mesorhizobium sp. NZP2077]QKD18539.1 DUF1778 domain-containing protein [Mesorhizobium sp. NZP2077]
MPNKQAGIVHTEAAQPSIEAAVIHLSIEDQIALVEAIMNPPEPNEALRKAAKAYKRLVAESR